jgi:hypothetical protein
LVFGDLAGDVGDHRAVTSEFSWVLVETGQSGQFDLDVDHALASCCFELAAVEQVDEDVGSDLVHAPMVVGGLGGFGQGVDPSHRGLSVGCGEVDSEEVGGAVGVGFEHHPPLRNRLF